MFTTNHFAELSASIPISIIQAYVLAMIALVAGGTIYDVIHKQSAKYFFNAVKIFNGFRPHMFFPNLSISMTKLH